MNIFYFIALIVGPLLEGMTKIELVMIILGQNNLLKSKKFWLAVFLVGMYILSSYLITANAIKVIIDFMVLAIGCCSIINFDKKYFFQIIIISFIVWVSMLLIDIFTYVTLFNIFKIEKILKKLN